MALIVSEVSLFHASPILAPFSLMGMGGFIGLSNNIGGTPTLPGVPEVPGILVNKYGRRFVSESDHYAWVLRSVFAQEDHIAW